jgi:acyl carrier protein phosphodiesterase
MNFLAHVLVATRTGPRSPDRLVGSVLPDLAAMAGCRLRPELLDGGDPSGEVREGVTCHHAVDRAFHADRAFTAGARRLRCAALEAGLPAGPSRAVGHAGWELLLDGVLLSRTGVVADFAMALAAAPPAAGLFAPGDRGRWLGLVDHLATTQWWRRYGDPAVVAAALHRRLRRRRRLAFGLGEVPTVAGVLAAELASVATDAGPVVDRVVDAVGGNRARQPVLARSPAGP